MAKVISLLKPEITYVDAVDVLENRFKQHILENLTFKPKIVSEHKADRNYPVVSAASIVAKVARDKEIAGLAKQFGRFGSGYPSDPKTILFLQQCAQQGIYPECVRKSWKIVRKLQG
jgi:ribonuclease HII